MRVLVTGAAGRVGRRSVEALLTAGHDVHGLDLHPTGNQNDRYSETIGALQDPAVSTSAMEGVDTRPSSRRIHVLGEGRSGSHVRGQCRRHKGTAGICCLARCAPFRFCQHR